MRLASIVRTGFAWSTALPLTAATSATCSRGLTGDPHRTACWWARTVLRLAGVELRVEGPVPRPADGACVVMANHGSRLDIPLLLATVPADLKPAFMAKASLFRGPFLGPVMRALGCVAIDREDGSTAAASFRESAGRLQSGRALVVFPEQTWSPDDELLEFKRGGFLVAMKTGAAIVPVGLDGARHVMAGSSLRVDAGTVVVRYGAPLATRGLGRGDRAALTARVRSEIEDLRGRP